MAQKAEDLIGTPPKPSPHVPNPADSYARVELYRWQYGELPPPENALELDEATGLRGMAAAIEKVCNDRGNVDDMPTPFNVCEILNYCARRLQRPVMADNDAANIPQPGYDDLGKAYAQGIRDACKQAGYLIGEDEISKAADAYCKLHHANAHPRSFQAMGNPADS